MFGWVVWVGWNRWTVQIHRVGVILFGEQFLDFAFVWFFVTKKYVAFLPLYLTLIHRVLKLEFVLSGVDFRNFCPPEGGVDFRSAFTS